MKRLGKVSIFAILLSLITVSAAVDLSAQTRRRPVLRKKAVVRRTLPSASLYSVASGEQIRARMNGTLSSKTARVGQTFTANVTEPVYSTKQRDSLARQILFYDRYQYLIDHRFRVLMVFTKVTARMTTSHGSACHHALRAHSGSWPSNRSARAIRLAPTTMSNCPAIER